MFVTCVVVRLVRLAEIFEKDKNVAADYFVLHTCGIDHRGGIVSIDVQLTLRASLFSTN